MEKVHFCLAITLISCAVRVLAGMLHPNSLIEKQLTVRSLIAVMLGKLRMDFESCIKEYKLIAQKVFGKPRAASQRVFGIVPWTKYSAEALEASVQSLMLRSELRWGDITAFETRPQTCATFVFLLLNRCHPFSHT